jgi:hypothetical protein
MEGVKGRGGEGFRGHAMADERGVRGLRGAERRGERFFENFPSWVGC